MTDPNLIRPFLDKNSNLPNHKMKYDGQVIWCLDPSDQLTSRAAGNLQGKRMAAGDADKSHLVFGLNGVWPRPFPRTTNVRLYIVAHGIEVILRSATGVTYDTHIQVRPDGTPKASIAVEEFYPMLKSFLDGCPANSIRRISLAMCISAGIRGKISPEHSFAKKLADLACEYIDDLTGRAGNVTMPQTAMARSDVDELFAGKPNPLYTFKIGTTDASLINTWKHVDGRRDFGTYIFSPGSPPQLKPGYSE